MDLTTEMEKYLGDIFDDGVKAGLSFAAGIVEHCESLGLTLETARDAIVNLRENHRAP